MTTKGVLGGVLPVVPGGLAHSLGPSAGPGCHRSLLCRSDGPGGHRLKGTLVLTQRAPAALLREWLPGRKLGAELPDLWLPKSSGDVDYGRAVPIISFLAKNANHNFLKNRVGQTKRVRGPDHLAARVGHPIHRMVAPLCALEGS